MIFDPQAVHIQLLEVILFRAQNENFLPPVLLLKISVIKQEVKNFHFKPWTKWLLGVVYGWLGDQKAFLVQNKFIFIIFGVILSRTDKKWVMCREASRGGEALATNYKLG